MKILKPDFWDKTKFNIIPLVLLPISLIYQLLLFIKNIFIKEKSFSIPIICIGNIYLGGTGKTPLCIKIFNILKDLKMRPIIIKKEYKNQKDELFLLKKYCDVLTSKKRSIGIEEAIKKNYNVVILDDGFQDFEIKKDINIVCFNMRQKIGNGFTIPSGPLRQSLKTLKKCNMVLLNGKRDENFENNLRKYNSQIEFFYYEYFSKNILSYKNQKIIASAGIGNPVNFFSFLKENNLNVVKEIKFPDHYIYTEEDLNFLISQKIENHDILLTTEKDFMRIKSSFKKKIEYISIKTVFEKQDFDKKIKTKLNENN